MSVFPRNRALLGAILFLTSLLLPAQAVLAAYPSARTEVRMALDPETRNLILFGGQTEVDGATGLSYDLDETWAWVGDRWVQRFPLNSPPGRSGHVMATDTNRNRIVMFGGRQRGAELNDTWIWKDDNWTEVQTANAPSKRLRTAMAYDPIRDRMVLFGGDVRTTDGKTLVASYDTWEFDGTTWTRVIEATPAVARPTLVYDEARHQMILLGVNEKGETLMHIWNDATKAWDKQTPSALPPCVNESGAVYQQHNQRIILNGGVCTTSTIADETWEWNGTTWAKLDTEKTDSNRTFGHALGYDPLRQATVSFGGTLAFSSPRDDTYIFKNGKWAIGSSSIFRPQPRSLGAFTSDPDSKSVWLVGGLMQEGYTPDFWRYQYGGWSRIVNDKTPASCVAPMTAYDTDRKVMVLVCGAVEAKVYEWSWNNETSTGTWKVTENLKTFPPARRNAHMVYDPQLKKTVLFAGFDEAQYRNDTWVWDGTAWNEVKKDRPTARSLAATWFDPTLKKVVMYGGIGRPDPEDRIVRYDDMWSFSGTGWTKMTPSSTPGQRYGAQITVDPRTNTTILFGGILYTENAEKKGLQVYSDETWEWNGTTWTKLTTTGKPLARENAQFAFDPSTNQIVMYAGWTGYYLSDTWKLAQNRTWTREAELLVRRRAARN
ncbi:MAG TPA: hypothetical protein VGF69_08705 [Thermoanaerobaculia bacterium]|jgi:hypothetical protein